MASKKTDLKLSTIVGVIAYKFTTNIGFLKECLSLIAWYKYNVK